jgi:ERCC4-type nuclease
MIKVIVDTRELNSPVPKALEKLGADLEFKTMEVGDYVVSDRVGFERKNINDFMNSWLIEKKLLGQIGDLAKSYDRPVLIIEGGNPFYAGRNVHPNAIHGILNTIAVSFRVPILYSLTPDETAKIIMMIAKREQTDDKRPFQLHGKRSHLSIDGQREYIVSAIPDIGTVVAQALLSHFGSVQAVMCANDNELIKVSGIGKVSADKIRNIVGGKYESKTI